MQNNRGLNCKFITLAHKCVDKQSKTDMVDLAPQSSQGPSHLFLFCFSQGHLSAPQGSSHSDHHVPLSAIRAEEGTKGVCTKAS